MFYAHFVLSKKGPLAKIWLAAHWDKKLTKAQIFETNIEGSVEAIIQPQVKLALRTSGHLLLGVVRIYSRKAKYLLADCNEALVKIKMAFRPGVVDLPEELREAAIAAVTLPETFPDFENVMLTDLTDFEIPNRLSMFQSRREDITMKEDLANINFFGDDGFGDIPLDGGDGMLELHFDDPKSVRPSYDDPIENDFGDDIPMDIDLDLHESSSGGSPEVAVRDEGPGSAVASPVHKVPPVPEALPRANDLSDNESFNGDADYDDGEVSINVHAAANRELSVSMVNVSEDTGARLFEEPETIIEEPVQEAPPSQHSQPAEDVFEHQEDDPVAPPERTVAVDQTTLLSNDAEAFALGPIDVTNLGTERKSKRKRKLIIDEIKSIPSDTMRTYFSDTSDITAPLDLAPPSKKLMEWKELGSVDKLFILPGRRIYLKKMTLLYKCNLLTRSVTYDFDAEIEKPPEVQKKRNLEERRDVEEIETVRRSKRKTASVADHSDASLLLNNTNVEDIQNQLEITRPSIANSSIVSLGASMMADVTVHNDTLVDNLSPARQEPPLIDLPQNPPTPCRPEDQSTDQLVLPPLPPTPKTPIFCDMTVASLPDVDQSLLALNPRSVASEIGFEEDPDDAIFNKTLTAVPSTATTELLDGDDEEQQLLTLKRSNQMLQILQRHLKKHDTVVFRDVTRHNNRKQVASKFYTLLVLKKMQAINVSQKESTDIFITRGPKFDNIN